MVKEAITKVVDGADLTRDEARSVMEELMSGQATDAQIGSFLTALRLKGETVDEITGMVEVMRAHATPIKTKHEVTTDTCGTGGDRSDTFNISTLSALVAAGAGACVAKHGNRSVSSFCGSADILKSLGVNIEIGPDKVGQCLDEAGIGFLFAPLLHGAMKHVIGPRREMGIRTAFNILGPMTNPAGATRQVIGVYDPALVESLAGVLQNLGSEHVMVFNGSGLDELTTTGPSQVAELKGGKVTTYTLDPEELGIKPAQLADIKGGSVEESTVISRNILKGEPGPCRDIVLLNAGAAIYVSGKAGDLKEGVRLAAESIDSGKAQSTLDNLVKVSNS